MYEVLDMTRKPFCKAEPSPRTLKTWRAASLSTFCETREVDEPDILSWMMWRVVDELCEVAEVAEVAEVVEVNIGGNHILELVQK
jgi:hypothetical protein